jgi:hypothetical protein
MQFLLLLPELPRNDQAALLNRGVSDGPFPRGAAWARAGMSLVRLVHRLGLMPAVRRIRWESVPETAASRARSQVRSGADPRSASTT